LVFKRGIPNFLVIIFIGKLGGSFCHHLPLKLAFSPIVALGLVD